MKGWGDEHDATSDEGRIKQMKRLLKRLWWRITHRRFERVDKNSCRGRIDAHVREIDRLWRLSRDRWALQSHRDSALHGIRWSANELSYEITSRRRSK
jgi:hypothetical protein